MSPKDYLHPHSVPAGVVRDLLAICRVLYVTRKNEGAGADELNTIVDAGKAFATALKMAHCKPDTALKPSTRTSIGSLVRTDSD